MYAPVVEPQYADGFKFERFLLIPKRQLLLAENAPVRIGGRPFEMLLALVESAGQIVSRQALMDRVWPRVIVDEANLKVTIGIVRRLLGDDMHSSRFIATVPGHGYRFVMPVERLTDAVAPDEAFTGYSGLPRHNLPVAVSTMFGRTEALVKIARKLKQSRLITLVGPGGIGKTTVSLAIAEAELRNFPEGAWLVELSPLAVGAHVPTTIATTLGISADSANVVATICEFLADRKALLIFDSCEHLIGPVAQIVQTILAAAANVKVIATSREQLRLTGEKVIQLGGLACPPENPDLSTDVALGYGAVALFADRASDRLETFRLDDRNVAKVAEICRRLEGHALAIELAATRVGSFDVASILDQLKAHRALKIGSRAGPERHRTLSAAIDWSYRLLCPGEQVLLQQLSVFSGPFNAQVGIAICQIPGFGETELLDGLCSLVDKSLLATEVRGDCIAYRLWDATREFALERLRDAGLYHAARQRHANKLLQTLTGMAERLADGSLDDTGVLTHTLDEVRSAMDWAFSTPGSGDLGVKLTIAATSIWKRLSLPEECRVAVARALDEVHAASRTQAQDLVLLQTLSATILDTQGTLPEVKTALEDALAIATALDDRRRQLECLQGLSEYELWTGDSHAALRIAEQMRSVSDSSVVALASAEAGRGTALEWLGDLEQSRVHLERALSTSPPHYAKFDEGKFEFNQRLLSHASMIHVLWLQGKADQSKVICNQMLREADRSNYAWSYCFARFQAATLMLHIRDYAAGKQLLDEGMAHALRHAITYWHGTVAAGGLARWKLYTGQLVDLAEMRLVLRSMRERSSRMYLPHILTNYGEAVARQDDLAEGLAAIDEAIALCQDTGQIVVVPEILRIKGNVIRFQSPGKWDGARACYQEALDQSVEDGTIAWEIRAATSLVNLMRDHGGDEQAEQSLVAAYGKFAEGFETGDLLRARRILQRDD